MGFIYIPKMRKIVNIVVGLIITYFLNKNIIYSSALWTVFIFLGSVMFTSLVKFSTNKKNKEIRKRKNHQRRHPEVQYVEYKLRKIEQDYDLVFSMSTFVLGMLVTSIVVTIYYINRGNLGGGFQGLSYALYINTFLIPFIAIIITISGYDDKNEKDLIKRISNMIHNLLDILSTNRNGKKKPLKGIMGLMLIVIFSIMILAYKVQPFLDLINK